MIALDRQARRRGIRTLRRGTEPRPHQARPGRIERRSTMAFRDLREFISQVEKFSRLRHVDHADPYLEIGGITEIAAGLPEVPALLFDNIKGFPRGYRVFTNPLMAPERAALALGIDPTLRPIDALRAWMKKRQGMKIQKPISVQEGPFLENSYTGANVDQPQR